jgi:Tol biopolymer transport system component
MIKKNLTVILFFVSSCFFAQSVQVVETTKLPINLADGASYPRFSKDDSKILYSSSSYKGLYSYDLNTKLSSSISEMNGAGYNPLILDDETILYRTFNIENGKKYHSVKSFGLKSGTTEIIEADKRSLKLPNQLPANEIVLVENSQQRKKEIGTSTLSKSTAIAKAIYVENNNLYLVEGEETIILNPLGEGIYIWESISNNGNRILFSFGNRGAFICDLDGNIIENIEDAHYPKFSPDGKFISYMLDEDDGYNYTSSDIYIYSVELHRSFSITDTKDEIEMFAEWSNDGNQLVYHTTNGNIYSTKLQYEN